MRTLSVRTLLAAWVLTLGVASLPLAAGIITVDPNGDGTANSSQLAWSIINNSGPGGQNGVLSYALPFASTPGDLVLTFADFPQIPLIVARFNGDGTLIFYAANVGGPNLLADTASPPGALYDNALEDDLATNYDSSMAIYTPASGDPGYDASNPTYDIYSYPASTSTPEPATFGAGLGGLVLAGILCRRKRLGCSIERQAGQGRNTSS